MNQCQQVVVSRWDGGTWEVIRCLEEAIHFIEGRWYCKEHHRRHRHRHHHVYCDCKDCCK